MVTIKKDMRILLKANIDPNSGLVNGSQGTIVGFEPFDESKLPRKSEGSHAKYAERQIKIFAIRNQRKPWPIVEFDNGRTRTIYADCTCNEVGDEPPYSVISRAQIPLVAGYTLSIHKSQAGALSSML